MESVISGAYNTNYMRTEIHLLLHGALIFFVAEEEAEKTHIQSMFGLSQCTIVNNLWLRLPAV